MHGPVMLRDFIDQYQENRITATKWQSPKSKIRSLTNSFLIDTLVFKSCRSTQYQETNSKLEFRVTKSLNDPKSGNSGGAPSEENQKECVLTGTTLF